MKQETPLIHQCISIKRLFFVGLYFYLSSSTSAYAQNGAIKATIRDGLPLQLDVSSQQLLSETGIQRSQLEALAETINSYQSDRNESLGIQVGTDLNNTPILKSNPRASANEISITQSALIELTKKYELNTPQDNQNLELSIERKLSGQGIHEKEVKNFSHSKGETFQTVDPINGETSPEETQRINNICPDPNINCIINSVIIDSSGLGDSVTAPPPDHIPANLAQCRDAMTKFRLLHLSLGSHSAPEEISKDAEIWMAAEEFEEQCLEKPTYTDNVSVIKFTHEGNDPYCSAFRIGPKQFVTAIHCFLENGRLDLTKASDSSLYLLDKPDEGVAFDITQESIDNFNTRFNGRVPNNQVPAYRDFLILNTETFDDKSEANFDSIIATPIIGQRVLLPGYFAFHSERKTSPSNWIKGIRSTKTLEKNYCKLYDVSKSNSGAGCLIHRCQAIGGYSGSPILQEQNDGTLALVGIHVRGAGNYKKHCPGEFSINKIATGNSNEPITSFANIAVFAKKELLVKSGWNNNGADL